MPFDLGECSAGQEKSSPTDLHEGGLSCHRRCSSLNVFLRVNRVNSLPGYISSTQTKQSTRHAF